MPSACFKFNNKSTIATVKFSTYYDKKNTGGCALKCILLLYLWGEYLQIFLNCFLQFKWVLNAFLDFAILVDDE